MWLKSCRISSIDVILKTLTFKTVTMEKQDENAHPLLKEMLTPEFLKQFKDSRDLNEFIDQLFVKGMEQMLEGELDGHLGYAKHSPEGIGSGNSRNGKTTKRIKSKRGEHQIQVPRDRNGTFDPLVVPKRSRFVEGIEEVIISLYARGMSVRDIEVQIRELYGVSVSDSTISNVTSRIHTLITEWQSRPLSRVYFIVWMDGMVFKVRQNGKVINKTIYLAVGLNSDGYKEILGMWLGENESASFWMSVLTDLRTRGVHDILITSTDNLKGFTEAITSIFTKSVTQICVVHQIRNALRFVVWKDKRQFADDLKRVYSAPNHEIAAEAFNKLQTSWAAKYPHAIKSWKVNWDNLTHFFNYPVEIRTLIYTTNVIENLNGKVRKYTNAKMSFPDDQAVLKSVYLALREISKKWTHQIKNWPLILNQFLHIFEDRCKI
jgi:putative transposase